VLTGRETVPATFAATAHLHRAAPAALEVRSGGVVTTVWGALVTEVRHAALALADDGGGPGLLVALDRTAPRAKRAVAVLVASVVGAEVVAGAEGADASGQLDLPGLAAVGAGMDERAPDRYEDLVGRRSPDDPLLRDGPVVHTSGTLLVAARSLAQAADIGLEDRLAVDLAVGSVTEIVAGLLVPCLTGAATWVADDGVAPGDVPAGQGPTFVATATAAAGPAAATAAGQRGRRRVRRRDRQTEVRTVVVGGDGGGPVTGPEVSGFAVAAAGGIVTGFGRPGTLGRPLPGASIAIDDDGAVLVRAASTAPGAPGLRDDGWLPTGLSGTLDDGHLVVAEVAPPDPS
jgi:hypothetical protein